MKIKVLTLGFNNSRMHTIISRYPLIEYQQVVYNFQVIRREKFTIKKKKNPKGEEWREKGIQNGQDKKKAE